MTDGAFDAAVAARYDRDVAERFEPTQLHATVKLLAELADGRPALEFAIGTGRVALPLADRGVEVHGIELSQAMVDQLRLWIADGDTATFESHHRYAWPAEYDLMAELAGMRLTHRWADWTRSPFTSDSAAHVSVWSSTT